MNTPKYNSKIDSHIVEVYCRDTPDFSPETAYLKLEDYLDLFIASGYCPIPELRWLKFNGTDSDCFKTITFLNRFYDASGLQFVPISTKDGRLELSNTNVCEFIVLNKFFSKSHLEEFLNEKNKLPNKAQKIK